MVKFTITRELGLPSSCLFGDQCTCKWNGVSLNYYYSIDRDLSRSLTLLHNWYGV